MQSFHGTIHNAIFENKCSVAVLRFEALTCGVSFVLDYKTSIN